MSSENPRAFGKGAVERIMREMGISRDEATRIASTEMDGANENSDGTINSRQTHCGMLRYDENLPPSRGAQEGRATTLKSAADELGISTAGKSASQIQTEIDREINRRFGI